MEAEAALDFTPLKPDELHLAMLATEHPAIQAFGKAVEAHVEDANALLSICAPWQEANNFPKEALQKYRFAQEVGLAMLRQVEKLDSIDLDNLKPSWGDRDTVRASRRGAIAFAQCVMDRLDGLQALLASPANRIKEEQSVVADTLEPSLQDKYKEHFLAQSAAVLSDRDGASRPAKRQRKAPATKAEVQALLRKIRGTRDVLRQPNKAFYRRLLNLASQDLPNSPTLCKDASECILDAATCAVESAPSGKVLGKLFHALQQLQASAASDLPGILLDMADAVRGLP